jgi:hypothetical protein
MQKLMYPNIYYILTVLLMAPVSAAAVERTNSSLHFIRDFERMIVAAHGFAQGTISDISMGYFSLFLVFFISVDL